MYIVLSTSSRDTITQQDIEIDELESLVKSYIDKGWEPIGGVAISTVYYLDGTRGGYPESHPNTIYAQAMRKKISILRTFLGKFN